MFKNAFRKYINNFRGFTREIWILTLITFINRAGTMVFPFLSKYLKEDLHFSYREVAAIMICFGLGSMVGSWLGGKLSDKIGFYRIMVFSLFTSGLGFLILQFITSFVGLCIGIFSMMVIADMFRPAMFVSLGVYAKPENRARALTLVRLAINLGFIAGPALGGLIIMEMGYQSLFWVDGATCIIAIFIFWFKVKEKKKVTEVLTENSDTAIPNSIFKDKPFWIFLSTCTISGVLFFQLFSPISLYHKVQFNLTELQTGLLLTMNGIIIFFLEMPIVSYVERKKIDKVKMVTYGTLLMSISLFLLIINSWAGILIIMMLFMTFGEILTFPFSNSFAMSRATKGNEGKYMAIFTMSYSFAQILSGPIGLEIIRDFSYQTNWIVMGSIGLLGTIIGFWVIKLVKQENRI